MGDKTTINIVENEDVPEDQVMLVAPPAPSDYERYWWHYYRTNPLIIPPNKNVVLGINIVTV